jgi:acyl-homoserine-lactone acylase
MIKKLAFLILLAPLGAVAQKFTPQEITRYEQRARQVNIVRDNWGVPHIYGKTDADAVFGLMYSQCEENFKGVELNWENNHKGALKMRYTPMCNYN